MTHHKDGEDVINDFTNVCNSILQAKPDQAVYLNRAMNEAQYILALFDQIKEAADLYVKESGDPTLLMGHFVVRLNNTFQAWEVEIIERLRRA